MQDIDMLELSHPDRYVFHQQANRLLIIPLNFKLVASIEAEIFEQSIPPDGFLGDIREHQQLSYSGRRTDSLLFVRLRLPIQ